MRFSFSVLFFSSSAGVAFTPAVPSGMALDSRAGSCTFTDAASAAEAKGSCPTLTLNNIAVPAGKTLDLTDLAQGTHV